MFKKFFQTVDKLLGRGVIDDDLYEQLEIALIQADTNIQVAMDILEELRQIVRNEKITDVESIKERLEVLISSRLKKNRSSALNGSESTGKPIVYIFVGSNGVGKTTSIAKLAHKLQKKGHSVLLAAGDTFRAAAIDQLDSWAKTLNVPIVKSQPGGDSGAVIFDAIQSAKSKKIDYVLADTAGRQHSKTNLMNELQKVTKVAEKALGKPVDDVFLVIDAYTGQNALTQAEQYAKFAGITGLVITKLDGTSRGGAMLSICEKLNLPIKLVGTGESIDNLHRFDPEIFASNLLGS